MSEQKASTASLKDLLARLREISNIMEGSEHKLDFLASNSPQDKSENDTQSPVAESATLDDLNNIVDRISRRANHIAKSTNTIVGS